VLTILAGAALATTALGVAPATAQPSTPTTGVAIQAAAITPAKTMAKAAKTDALDKFTDKARQELKTSKTADYWIKLKGTADLSHAKSITEWNQRGQYVVDTLKAQAKESQKTTIAGLKKSGAEYQSFWLSNRVLVKGGTYKQATALAADPNVKEIHESVVMDKPDPKIVKKSGAKAKNGTKAVEWGIAETATARSPTTTTGSIPRAAAPVPPATARTTSATAPTPWAPWWEQTVERTRSAWLRAPNGSRPMAAIPAQT
jgi:hypothetical protein